MLSSAPNTQPALHLLLQILQVSSRPLMIPRRIGRGGGAMATLLHRCFSVFLGGQGSGQNPAGAYPEAPKHLPTFVLLLPLSNPSRGGQDGLEQGDTKAQGCLLQHYS